LILKILNNEQKLELQKELLEKIELFGSTSSFLRLLEDIRATSPHPLTSSPTKFNGNSGFVKWNKIIFKDKLILLSQIFNSKQSKILPNEKEKDYKKYLNLSKTLSPVIFTLKPKLRDLGDGFEFGVFDYENNIAVSISFMFQVVFFMKVNEVKQILKLPL
jgi:hypothetical protein